MMLPPAWILVAVWLVKPGEIHEEIFPAAWAKLEGCQAAKAEVLKEVMKRDEIVGFGLECVQLPMKVKEVEKK